MIAVFVNFAVMGILFVVPQYLQAVLGHDSYGTGIRVLPLIGGLMAAATASEALVPRLGARTVVPLGMSSSRAGSSSGRPRTSPTVTASSPSGSPSRDSVSASPSCPPPAW